MSVHPTLVVQIAFTNAPLTADGSATWVDVGSYARQDLSIQRGRNHERDVVQAGTATLTLSNTDRRFDPDNASSPYFPNVLPMRKIRIGASYDAASYLNPEWLFVGYVESWKMRYEGGTIAYADLTCVDAFKYFSLITVTQTTAVASEISSVRVTRVLDAIINTALDPLWPAGDRVIATGNITMPSMEISETALAHLQKVAKAEDGLFFISRSGDATFQNQNYRDALLSVATFNNTPAGADLPYATLRTRYDDTNIWNQIYVTRFEGDIEQTAYNDPSRAAYLTRSLRLSGELLVDDTAALARAQRLLARYKDARVRPEKFEIDPAVRDSWANVLQRDLSDRITIGRGFLQDGGTVSISAHIEAIGIVIRNNRWRVTWQLSPVVTLAPAAGTLATLSIWRAPTLLNSWVNSGGINVDAGYFKDRDGWVHLRGLVKDGTVGASASTIFTLPVGYRPPKNLFLTINATNALGTVNVQSDGDVVARTGTNTFFDLSSIDFRVY